MNNAINSIAVRAYSTRASALLIVFSLALSGCGLTRPTASPVVYDFGPGRSSSALTPAVTLAPLILDQVQASSALDSNALLYRLAYIDAQQLRPYAHARWSMPPPQLVRQRLREQLGQDRALLEPGAIFSPAKRAASDAATGLTPPTLRLELEEFSQLFEAPNRSVGLLRLRATLTQASPTGDALLGQRSVVLQRPAPSADAAGGVQALRLATDAAAQELAQWLAQLGH